VVAVSIGQEPRAQWLLVIPALLLLAIFCTGAALTVARMGSVLTDTAQLLPFITRTWMYLCGVMYSLASVAKASVPHWIQMVLYYDPPALFITVVRNCMIKLPPMPSLGGAPSLSAALSDCTGTTPSLSKATCSAVNTYQSNIDSMHQPGSAWLWLAIWAVLAGVGGFVYFWKAEEQYGRG
jgi:teichoic acid transport system permease protein